MATNKNDQKNNPLDETQPSAPPAEVSPPVEQQPAEQQLDKTVPGGRYLVNGQLVDANGKPIEKKD